MGWLLFIGALVAVAVYLSYRQGWMSRKDTKGPAVSLRGFNTFSMAAVGTSNYQRAIRSVAGVSVAGDGVNCRATLIPERGNPHDPKAVRVEISGRHVGYLSRDNAAKFRERMASAGFPQRAGTCDAVIIAGGGQNFGVRLDLALGATKFKAEE